MYYPKFNSSTEDIIKFLGLNGQCIEILRTNHYLPVNFKQPNAYVVMLRANNFQVDCDAYFVDNKCELHSNNLGPSRLVLSKQACSICYYSEEYVYHRINGPAYIGIKSGVVTFEDYYINGKRHNPTGPALRYLERNKWINRYFINNHELSTAEFFNRQ